MKRKLASALIVTGLLGFSMTPANAVFGLSKCEKVKKEMLTLVKQMLGVRNYQGYTYTQVVFRMESKIWEPIFQNIH